MLAPRELPDDFAKWNKKYRAPFGADWWRRLLCSQYFGMFSSKFAPGRIGWNVRTHLPSHIIRSIGPFGFQLNSATRRYEYPWAFFATPWHTNMKVIDLGAGAGGFQFILAAAGAQVTSVDPLINPSNGVDWKFSEDDFSRINRAFGNRVKFINTFLEEANLETAGYDRVYAISVLEHLPQDSLPKLIQEISRLLKPGGYFVATIDLFLHCYPFTMNQSNKYGSNISVKKLSEVSDLRLIAGKTSELYGYDEFSTETIKINIENYLVVDEVTTQCIVMQK